MPAPGRPSTSASKATLVVAALGGVALWHLASIAPFAVFLLANPLALRWGPWPILVTLAVLWWAMRPSHVLPGRPIERSQAPALFETVDALADALAAPRVDLIRLDDRFNAGAMEWPSRWRPGRPRRVLVLGVPLLALADVDTARSVISHELGHFSHRHGRLGHWVYRARVGWLDYARGAPRRAPLHLRASVAFARWFTPRFARLSAAYARRCEFEADTFGAAVVGRQAMGAGLLSVALYGDRWSRAMDDGMAEWVARQPHPPATWLAQVQAMVLTQPPQSVEWERLRTRVSDAFDSHPSLGERLEALGVEAEALLRSLPNPALPAGAAWLADWLAAVAEHDAAWVRLHGPRWRCAHVLLRHATARLALLREARDEGIERARLELAHGDCQAAEAIARTWQDDSRHGAEACCLLGAARLQASDPAGVTWLEAGIAKDPAWAFPARVLIDDHAGEMADEAARQRNRALLDQARERRRAIRSRMRAAVLVARLSPAALEPMAHAVLRDALAGMPAVAGAWCAGFDDLVAYGRRFRGVALLLRLRPEVLQQYGIDEDALRAEVLDLLVDVLPADAVGCTWTAYTTEHLSIELDGLLAAWSAPGTAACLVAPEPGEAVGPGVRATALG